MNENKFDGMGKIYSEHRPSYPKELLDYLYSETGLTRETAIADIGSGTGILTRLLLSRGNAVYAVEPNADMLKELVLTLEPYPNAKGRQPYRHPPGFREIPGAHGGMGTSVKRNRTRRIEPGRFPVRHRGVYRRHRQR